MCKETNAVLNSKIIIIIIKVIHKAFLKGFLPISLYYCSNNAFSPFLINNVEIIAYVKKVRRKGTFHNSNKQNLTQFLVLRSLL